MNEVVKQIVDRTGISEDQAKKAVEVVAGFLKQRLPGSLAGQVDSFLGQGGQAANAASATGSAKDLGGKLGL